MTAKNTKASRSAKPVVSLEQARVAKTHTFAIFGKIVNVASVGITRTGKGYGLKVNLLAPAGSYLHSRFPAAIDGVPIVVEVVGRLHKVARATKPATQRRHP